MSLALQCIPNLHVVICDDFKLVSFMMHDTPPQNSQGVEYWYIP